LKKDTTMLPRYYETIGEPKDNSEIPNATEETPLYTRFTLGSNLRQKCNVFLRNIRDIFMISLLLIVCIIVFCFMMYIIMLLIGILFVLLQTTFEITIVFLFGKATYQKNFPTCSQTIYDTQLDCYTTHKMYCS